MSTANHIDGYGKIGKILNSGRAKICIIGIGGISTSAIAEHLSGMGHTVWGSDDAENENTKRLLRLGIGVTAGNRNVSVFGADLVCYSLAVGEDCPPLRAARAMGIPTVSRALLLGELMRGYDCRIGICGTHGKSTTVAMAAAMLRYVGERPTVFAGAALEGGSPYLPGNRKYLLFEACEYRDSFHAFYPTDLLATNIEIDHTDYFNSTEALLRSFRGALSRADRCALNIDDPLSRTLAESLPEAFTFGSSEGAELKYTKPRVTRRGISLSLTYGGERITLDVPTISPHDGKNAAAAVAALTMAGVPFRALDMSLRDYRGLSRRCELLRYIYGRPVYYDYAHHPTEIESTLQAIRDRHGAVTVIFCPHTYTRTRDLWEGFVRSLSIADYAGLLDIYAAREEPIAGVSSARLAEAVGGVYLTPEGAAEWAVEVGRGAIVLMGAGDCEPVRRGLMRY